MLNKKYYCNHGDSKPTRIKSSLCIRQWLDAVWQVPKKRSQKFWLTKFYWIHFTLSLNSAGPASIQFLFGMLHYWFGFEATPNTNSHDISKIFSLVFSSVEILTILPLLFSLTNSSRYFSLSISSTYCNRWLTEHNSSEKNIWSLIWSIFDFR